MIDQPVTYGVFYAFLVEDQPSLVTTSQVIRDFATRQAVRPNIAAFFIVMSMVFGLAFPTLASAMTGYTVQTDAFVSYGLPGGGIVPFSTLTPIAYVIYDGGRVNLTDNYLVPYEQPASTRSFRVHS